MRVPHHSPRRPRRRPLRAGGAAVIGLATIALTGAFATSQASAATSVATPRYAAINDSVSPTSSTSGGAYSAAKMTVEVALAPRDQAGLQRELRGVYTAGSGQYHKFLARGQFDARYAPSAASVAAVENYLHGQGLSVAATNSPFLLTATGSSARVAATFRTSLDNYVSARGVRYFANSRPAYLPASIASAVQGVVGLTDTVRLHSLTARPAGGTVARSAPAASATSAASCETGYPTTRQLFNLLVSGDNVPLGYGGGPGCTGLTPSQTNSVYGAPAASRRTQGAGVNAAVFELSAYKASDISTWAHNFYGSGYKPATTNVTVDGGPLAPKCPAGDTCPAEYNGYSGDIEVDADIEQEMAVAPDARVYVYNAPNDETGQTELDEYTAIANQDVVATVSSSWGECEADAGKAYAQAENTVFEQMALQGQSMMASAGDSGAFDCITISSPTSLAVDDPGAQPWVTSVGGTSLDTDNPGTHAHPGAPARGVQTVWNPDNLCSSAAKSAANDNQGGYWWCGELGGGAGGGGSSKFWPAPFYQHGPGVTSKYTTHGAKWCALAASTSTPCRQVPDVSANADEFTGYAEYCTGNASTVNSTCAMIGNGGGWFAIGGTSLSAPLWGALITDRDSHQGYRTGNINPLVYGLLSSGQYSKYFSDIASPARSSEKGVVPATNNGHFPTRPGYDQATGAGAPKFAALIES
ncbi:MAG TPA: S53 family peptidase [Trebonia sp.]|jgi:kumamolisin|nr:S53 family peptidase [Trebonia sp.]